MDVQFWCLKKKQPPQTNRGASQNKNCLKQQATEKKPALSFSDRRALEDPLGIFKPRPSSSSPCGC